MHTTASVTIEGHVDPGFEAVRDAFAENFSERHELGTTLTGDPRDVARRTAVYASIGSSEYHMHAIGRETSPV